MTTNNESTDQDNAADAPWVTADHQVRVPNTSLLPGSEKPPLAAVRLLKNAVRGAHNTLDSFAANAAPAVQHLGERASVADDALHAKATQLRHMKDEWAVNVRATVRGNPLACIAAAMALGAVIARITRPRV